MKTRCVLIGAMNCESDFDYIRQDDFIILVDGGYLNCNKINPDLTIGDFDSLGYIPKGENIITYPVKKDDTDMMLAIKEALARGFEDFLILGGIGGRLDHTVANIQGLAYLKSRGKHAMMVGDGHEIFMLENESIVLSKRDEGIVSVFAYGDKAEDVTIEGLLYEVSHISLTPDFPLGVSNHWHEKDAHITVGNGKLLVITTQKEDKREDFS